MVAQHYSMWATNMNRPADDRAWQVPLRSSRLLFWASCAAFLLVAAVGCSRAPGTPTDQAKQLMRQADFAGAAGQWQAVLKEDPSVVEAWVGLGQCRFAQEDYRGAIDAYTSAIKIEPDNGQLFLYRSDAYDKLNERDAAIADWKRGTELHPDGWARVSPDAGTPEETLTHTEPEADSSTGSSGMTLPPVAPNLAGSQSGRPQQPGAVRPGAPQTGTDRSTPGRGDIAQPSGPDRDSDAARTTAPSRLQSPLPDPARSSAARSPMPRSPLQSGPDRGQPADGNVPGSPPPRNPLAALAAGEKVTGPPLPDGLFRPGDAQAQAEETEEPQEEDEGEPKTKPKPKSKPKPSDQRRRFVAPTGPWGSPWQPPEQYGPWGIPMWNQTSEGTGTAPSPEYGRSNWGAGVGLTSPTGVTGSAYADTWNSPAGSHGYAGSGTATVVRTPGQAEGGIPATEAGSPWRPPMVRPHSGVMLMDDARLNLDANLGVGPGTGIYQPRYNFNRPGWKEQPLPRPYGFERSIVPVPK